MVVKDIISHALLFAGKPELLKLSTFDNTSQIVATTAQQADIDLMLQCFNYVYKEISSLYFPLLHKEKIYFQDNKVLFSNLSKTPINIKKIYKNNKNLIFFIYPDHIYCETDYANIVYSALPDDLKLTDSTNLFGGRVLPQVMAYGVVREFAFINGDYSDADVWESRFKQGIKSSFSLRRINKIPKRKFI